MLCDLLLFHLAEAAFAASVAAEGIQRKGGKQTVAELVIEVTIGGMRLKDFVGFGTALVDEILHLPTVLTLAGGSDQAVEAIDKCAVATVRLSVPSPITAFPAQWAHVYSSWSATVLMMLREKQLDE